MTYNRVTIRTSEEQNPNSRVRPPSGKNLSSGVGFFASEWGFDPLVEL